MDEGLLTLTDCVCAAEVDHSIATRAQHPESFEGRHTRAIVIAPDLMAVQPPVGETCRRAGGSANSAPVTSFPECGFADVLPRRALPEKSVSANAPQGLGHEFRDQSQALLD